MVPQAGQGFAYLESFLFIATDLGWREAGARHRLLMMPGTW
jgi:hypothetical protein